MSTGVNLHDDHDGHTIDVGPSNVTCDWCDEWTPAIEARWHCDTIWCPACHATRQCACAPDQETSS